MSSTLSYKPAAEQVKRLREATNAGMMECRNALVESNGDEDRAKVILQERGQSKAAKKAERATNEGLVASYIHAGGKMGALVEVNAETDFVARNEKFAELVRDIAMHIVAMSPQYLDRQSVPSEEIERVKLGFLESVPAGKPAGVAEKIVEGKLAKWYEEKVLLDQPFVKNDELSVAELIAGVTAVLGENIKVRRFTKFALGE